MKCFVVMPFAKEFDDVYDVIKQAVAAAVEGEAHECLRMDEKRAAGRITDDLLQSLRHSAICISDVAENNPNVMWGTGYAAALQKPTIIITQDSKKLPFDLKDMRTCEYDRHSLTTSLRGALAAAVRETLERYAVGRQEPALQPSRSAPMTIALTGSMNILPNATQHRIEKLCAPYLGRDVTWLVGSFGSVDEIAAAYLSRLNERVVVVGYNEFDISGVMLSLVKEHRLPFVDVQREQFPQIEAAPSKRDVYFCFRADLILRIWNGSSAEVMQLQKWLQTQGKDHFIAFPN